MKRSVSLGVVFSAVVCLAYGCGGDDDDTTSSPHAGSAGKGGKGGAGGSAPKGGSAGRGGSSGNGANGGSAGAPRGGGSGRGGTAGDSGNAGQCTVPDPAPLAQCPEVTISEGTGRTIETSCSFEVTCDELGCGEPWSAFDEAGCYRPVCRASNQCGDGQRCVAGPLMGHPGCTTAVYEGCELESDCSCGCSASLDCGTTAYCVSAADHPPSDDCPLPSCEGIEGYLADLQRWTENIDTGSPTDVEIALVVCKHKVASALDRCQGHGGAGGGVGGEGGAGAGGQSGSGAGGQSGGGVGGH